MHKNNAPIQRLLEIMSKLRDPVSGCPWDKQQTFSSIVPFTIEEAYEVADAIESGDMADIKDELGDLLFQVVFYAQLGKEQGHFEFDDIAQTIGDKLVRRHPHVFADSAEIDAEQVSRNWELIKQQEREDKGLMQDASILANIPAAMTPLMRAHKIQKACAKVGFDWDTIEPVVDKVSEEIHEVLEELNRPEINAEQVEEEVGDLLFAAVNLARHANVNAETALRKANRKFEKRFRMIECKLSQQGNSVETASLEEMENLWREVKTELKKSG